jgi:hypothetical protein
MADSVAKLDQFPGNRPNKPQSPNDVASKPLPKSPANSSLDNVAPQMIIRSPRVRPGKFVFSDAKRLLQHNRHETDIDRLSVHVRFLGSSGHRGGSADGGFYGVNMARGKATCQLQSTRLHPFWVIDTASSSVTSTMRSAGTNTVRPVISPQCELPGGTSTRTFLFGTRERRAASFL